MDLERQKEIAWYVEANPSIRLVDIGALFGVHVAAVSYVARKHGVCRGSGAHPRNTQRDRQIIELLKSGQWTLQAIGDRHGVTRERIRQIGNTNGILSRKGPPRLDPDKIQQAVSLYNRGMPISHCADTVGIVRESLQNYLVRTGLHTPVDDDRPWTTQEVAYLRKHYGRRGAARKIADALGRTRNECIGKANRLGLCKSLPKQQLVEARA